MLTVLAAITEQSNRFGGILIKFSDVTFSKILLHDWPVYWLNWMWSCFHSTHCSESFHYQYDYINAMSQSIHYKLIFTHQGKKWLTSFSVHHLSPQCCSWHFASSVWKTCCPVTCITFCGWTHQTWGLFIRKKFQEALQTFVIESKRTPTLARMHF